MKLDIQIKGNKIYSPILEKMLPLTPEEEIRQNFICDLINLHGYKLEQMGQELIKSIGNDYVDIVIWKTAIDKQNKEKPSIIIVIECKAEFLSIDTKNFKNGYQFASISGAKLFVATNKKETKIYHLEDRALNRLHELKNFPTASVLKNNKDLSDFLKSSQTFNREDFSKLLFKCHNIIRNNDKLSPEAAFDEISKILFMKIRFERDKRKERLVFSEENLKEKKGTYSLIKPEDSFFQTLFSQTKEYFKDESLFEEDEILRIREASFFQIVKELEQYNLSDISDDIKGIAFEQFLGRTFRGELGQFFTPRTIVEFMTKVLDPQEGELICDPCCGSGGFLINAFEYVRNNIEKEIQIEKNNLKKTFQGVDLLNKNNKLDSEFDLKNHKGRLYNLSHNCIYGTDANPRMARTAKMNMIMHGDGHGGVHHNDGLLDVNGIYEGRFDVILTNPPFGARVEKSVKVTLEDVPSYEKIQIGIEKYGEDYEHKVINQLKKWAEQDNGKNKPKGKPIVEIFETGKMSTLTEVLFIERSLNLLKPGGRLGIVLPEGVLNNTNLQRIRDFVESQAKILLITSIPQDVFIASGATVKPSLLFFKKFTKNETKEWKRILKKATADITEKYEVQVNPIEEKLALRGKDAPSANEKKELRKQLQELKEKIETEIRAKLKKDFDYQIPIAEVAKAGISTTGAEIENELIPLSKEFAEYRRQNQLWENKYSAVSYEVMEDGKMFRIPKVGEHQEIYG
ncbi:MAG TPA: N-6 DNA methylase [Prolixibacteraceae bacterium]|nr:N-6 DNA methylase [Prolixibacteraceae bacterium]